MTLNKGKSLIVSFGCLLAVCMFYSCGGNNAESSTTDKAFETSRYDISSFSGRVNEFLRSRPETKNVDSYRAVFVNGDGCSPCVQGNFSAISDFLSGTPTKVFVYSNDSSLQNLVPDNKEVTFIRLPKQEFEKREILHTDLYMYSVNGEKLTTTHLRMRQRDSLNSLYLR